MVGSTDNSGPILFERWRLYETTRYPISGKAVVDDNEECVVIGESSEKICEAENLAGISEKVPKVVEGQRWTDKQMLCLVNGEMIFKSEKGRQEEAFETGKGAQQEHKTSVLDAFRVVKELATENEAEQDYNPQGASLVEAALGRGWKFGIFLVQGGGLGSVDT